MEYLDITENKTVRILKLIVKQISSVNGEWWRNFVFNTSFRLVSFLPVFLEVSPHNLVQELLTIPYKSEAYMKL